MQFASTSLPLILPAAMRTVVEILAVQAAIDTSLQRKSRLPIRKRHGCEIRPGPILLPMMRTTLSTVIFPRKNGQGKAAFSSISIGLR
jgi:hypothetical protein